MDETTMKFFSPTTSLALVWIFEQIFWLKHKFCRSIAGYIIIQQY